ncbi:MAG: TraM recognition domain-containing protein [Bdellovibrionota bacterium]
MAREYKRDTAALELEHRRYNTSMLAIGVSMAAAFIALCPVFSSNLPPWAFFLICGVAPAAGLFMSATRMSYHHWLETERAQESKRRGGKPVLGLPPDRNAFDVALAETREKGKMMIDRYLVGFELDSGKAIWVSDDDLCTHACVFAKTGVGKTLWLEGLMFQQMARGRASGFTFIDAKRDPGTLADIIMMALITGRIEDLIVVDPFDPVCSYNFVFTTQRPDVKARKVLRCGLPPTPDASTTKHYDRLAADGVYRVVRAMETFGLAWSVRDVAVALSAFNFAYPRMRDLLHEQGAKQAMIELGHMASSYRTGKGSLDSARLTDNLRGIASELHSIANSEAGEMFCAPRADLSLTDAILRGKFIYYMLPRLEEAESAARMVKVFREDLEVSIGEITSNRNYRLEDPHLVIIDEGASTFGPTWANLFELARKGRFALLFGAQSVGGLMDEGMGLSEQFYERVIANVNLKVIMRVGDNRTAEDMCEWIGKVSTTKKSFGTGLSTSLNARQLTKHLEFNKRTADGFREAVTVAEDEEDLVSAEELKHEMSAEKGLAWFDKGDGRLRKGRAFWFEADVPPTWEGREFLTRYESVEADEIGLAEWVDEHILSMERADAERNLDNAQGDAPRPNFGGGGPPSAGAPASVESHPGAADGGDKQEDGPFRFNLLRGFRGKPRARTFVGAPEAEGAASVSGSDVKEQLPESDHNVSESAAAVRTAPISESAPGDNGSAAKREMGKPSNAQPKPATRPAASQTTSAQPAAGQPAPAKPIPGQPAPLQKVRDSLSFQKERAPSSESPQKETAREASPAQKAKTNGQKPAQSESSAPQSEPKRTIGMPGKHPVVKARPAPGAPAGAPPTAAPGTQEQSGEPAGGAKQDGRKMLFKGKGRDTVADTTKLH